MEADRPRIRHVTTDDRAALARFFSACSSACHCRYWFFDGTKNDWLARCAFEEPKNEAELAEEIAREPLVGFVAIEEGALDEIIGWMRVTPRASIPRLPRLPVYRALDLGPDDGIASIACLLVRPDRREHGVARALVDGASLALGAHWTLEAYPKKAAAKLAAEEAWLGPEAVFRDAGFEKISPVAKPNALFASSTDVHPIYRRARSPEESGDKSRSRR